MQSYVVVSKNIRINSTHYFIMKIPNKLELQQITFNHSSDIDFMSVCKRYALKPNSFVVIDASLASDNFFRLRKNLLKRIQKLIIIIDDKIKDKKLYDINREVAKILALSSGKIDKYEYLTDEEILSSDQRQLIEQAKFTYSPLGKPFDKQTIEKPRNKTS